MEEEIMNDTQVLAGTSEIAEHFGVQTNVVGNWIMRHKDFPEPKVSLRMGRAWELNEVVSWFNDRWAPSDTSTS